MRTNTGTWCRALAMGGMLVCGATGCVVVNAGKPDVFTHRETKRETAANPARTELAGVRGHLLQRGNAAVAGIVAEWRDEYPKSRWEETVTVRRQKRLAFGLFPGAAEQYLMPKGALKSGAGLSRVTHLRNPVFCAYYGETDCDYTETQLVTLILTCGICQLSGTLNSLLVQPFADWPCHHDMVDGACFKKGVRVNGRTCADASQSPKIQALKRFPRSERRKMGFRVCWDEELGGDGMPVAEGGGDYSPLTHMGLVGFHKHLAVFVDPIAAGPRQADGVEVRTRRTDVGGPWSAELSIPALGYRQIRRVGRGETRAEFELPSAARACVADAVLVFRPDGAEGAPSGETRMALEGLEGKSHKFDVELAAGAVAPPPVQARQPVPAAAGRGVPRPAGTDGAPFKIVGIRKSPSGQYEVRARIADQSKTFDIGWVVEEDVRRIIREEFASRHPETGIQYVHVAVEWETEEDGAVLCYRGWGFSAQPVRDGWDYDPRTRRGCVRLRISDGMSPAVAKNWARENIESVVREKNVVLEAGKTLPPGAKYRSLSESLEDGVLTVEFEAVE